MVGSEAVERGPIQDAPFFPLDRLDALPGNIEVQRDAREIVIRQVRKAWVAERVVLMEQHQDREIRLVAEHARDGEASIGRAPERDCRTEGIEALQVHRTEFMDLVHGRGLTLRILVKQNAWWGAVARSQRVTRHTAAIAGRSFRSAYSCSGSRPVMSFKVTTCDRVAISISAVSEIGVRRLLAEISRWAATVIGLCAPM